MEINVGKNQYLLSERQDIVGYYSKIQIGKFWMYLGEACSVHEHKAKVYVVGYAVDVEHSHYDIEKMCNELDLQLARGVMGPAATSSWNGRWVVLVLTEQGIATWGDCCGLKQLFYYTGTGSFCIASQARYIAQIYGEKRDPTAQAYINQAETLDKEYSWPLDTTAYSNIKRLLPNHYMLGGKINRAPLNKGEGSVQRAAMLIGNSLVAANKIASLAVTLTAGWDSRLVLSGCTHVDQYSLVTLKYDWMDTDHQDICVAQALAEKVGQKHYLIDCERVSDEFKIEYMNHSENGHVYWLQMAQAIINGGFSKSFWVKGACNEIIRNSFGVLYNWQVNAKVICKLFKLTATPFVTAAVEAWLPEAKKYCDENGIAVLDLFYWEHRMGSWLAECLNEADIASEMFTPFNSRAYLENGLAVECKKRISPDYNFFFFFLKKGELMNEIVIIYERFRSVKAKMKVIIKNHLHLLYGFMLKV